MKPEAFGGGFITQCASETSIDQSGWLGRPSDAPELAEGWNPPHEGCVWTPTLAIQRPAECRPCETGSQAWAPAGALYQQETAHQEADKACGSQCRQQGGAKD